jgi:hypothetical protein
MIMDLPLYMDADTKWSYWLGRKNESYAELFNPVLISNYLSTNFNTILCYLHTRIMSRLSDAIARLGPVIQRTSDPRPVVLMTCAVAGMYVNPSP